MVRKFLCWLFCCPHHHVSFPMTADERMAEILEVLGDGFFSGNGKLGSVTVSFVED